MMGLPDGPKKFSDRFSRFDTIPAVTDTHPASQPPSHVAIAITLNALAKASSLKNRPFLLNSALVHVRSLLVTAQLALQVVSNVVSYACIAVSWQV